MGTDTSVATNPRAKAFVGPHVPWTSSWTGASNATLKQSLQRSSQPQTHELHSSPALSCVPAARQRASTTALGPTDPTGHWRRQQRADVPWVETGAAVSRQYQAARDEARDLARARNVYFEQVRRSSGVAPDCSVPSRRSLATVFHLRTILFLQGFVATNKRLGRPHASC